MPTKSERERIRSEHTDSWIAVEEGDFVTGKVMEIVEAFSQKRRGPDGKQGSHYPLLVIKVEESRGYTPGQELKLHCFSTVMYNEVEKHRPDVGERITFTYRGQGEAKPGMNAPELYRMRVHDRKDEGARVYGRLFSDSAPAAATATPVAPEVDSDIPF